MKKWKIVLITIASLIGTFGIYTIGCFTIKPKVSNLEEVVAKERQESFVFEENNKPTPSCHASTIAKFNNELYVAWFGGTGESKPDVTIWLSKSVDGTNWSTPVDMSEINDVAHWNPVLFTYQDTLYLYYKIGLHPDNWTTYVRNTKDGVNWSEEKILIEGDTLGRGPVKNKPILTSKGTVICPSSIEYKTKLPDCYVDITTDMKNYTRSKNVHSRLFVEKIQPALVEVEPGKIMMYIRTNRGRIYACHSTTEGRKWSHAKPIGLYNNNSGIDVDMNSNGIVGLVHNPVEENWGDRNPLILGLSYDKGKTWTKKVTIESQEGEFSYPSVICDGENFHIVYTYNREQIKYVKVAI